MSNHRTPFFFGDAQRSRIAGSPHQRRVAAEQRVDPEIARSWLCVNGDRTDTYAAAHVSGADQIILDLEEGVDPSVKDHPRSAVAEWLAGDPPPWVRMLAKTEAAEDVTERLDRAGGRLLELPPMQSALGVEEIVAIARAGGAFRPAFGSGDYPRATGVRADDMAMSYPRLRLVIARSIGGLSGPVDGPTITPNQPMLRDQTATTVAPGLTGKLCLNLAQPSVINEAISPTWADVASAQNFLQDFQAPRRVVCVGSDPLRLRRVRKTENLATAFTDLPARAP